MVDEFLYTVLGFLIIGMQVFLFFKVIVFFTRLTVKKVRTAKTVKKDSPKKDMETIRIPPNRVFHGTSLKKGREIYKTKMWLISEIKPRAVYLTTDFEIARSYAKKKGAIVDISVGRRVKLKKFTRYYDEGVYIYEIPDGNPYNEYYRINGLEPVGLLSYKGEKILE